ncbi:polyprotein [Narcissus yellow stripe virus]|uniref:Genome polyprotein n=7 Tax=Narcissus yellow stripe virus TaxID=160843 RepID=Q0VZC5_9POTV|nr:polyprotein [Narcissus yellow stripe virus]CAJ43612.1 polyprotein [Narcissus yellow stripe virus]
MAAIFANTITNTGATMAAHLKALNNFEGIGQFSNMKTTKQMMKLGAASPIIKTKRATIQARMEWEELQREIAFRNFEAKRFPKQTHTQPKAQMVAESAKEVTWKELRAQKLAKETLEASLKACTIGPWGPPACVVDNLPTMPSKRDTTHRQKVVKQLNQTKSMKVNRTKPERVKLNSTQFKSFQRKLFTAARDNNHIVDIIVKRKTSVRFVKYQSRTYAQVDVHHLSGKLRKTDMDNNTFVNDCLDVMAKITAGNQPHTTEEITFGWSGMVLRTDKLLGKRTKSSLKSFVVRGKDGSRLVDARTRTSYLRRMRMKHYSTAGEKFWKGFDTTFREIRTPDREHTCESDLDVEECGVVAAILCQAMYPCGRITCTKCVGDHTYSEGQATQGKIIEKVDKARELLKAEHPQFAHAVTLLDRYSNSLADVASNYDTFAEIQAITGGKHLTTFTHLNKLNAILVKGPMATRAEFTDAMVHLLEVARYLKNRTENIEKGTLKSFRNKISQKAHINPTLMCDNQLDKNGNFVWGERGYHAKRFFGNYFDIIDPGEGYSRFEVRKNPNGERKLAIGRLLVPTNFEALREQMRGEGIQAQPLTQECVSMLRGDYAHACCCVTNDNGEPLLSNLRMPTKHHLVIGNSGDSKYVDLPATEGNRMYIAKDGYCYINIFLAMLVNVNEADAKAFTKMVRDVLIGKLGKWPTLLDVATACCLLRFFFPDVGNAELPRMLVDHATKTIHVIDSYGSLTTGFHILKTNTIEQLIKFTEHGLESKLKYYLVGGDPLAEETTEQILSDPNWNLQLLIQGIYKPRVMQENLIWNRYLPLYAMLSPGILLAFYNSGSLETMTKYFLQKDNDLVVLLVILESLATKVSKSRSVLAQLHILEKGASDVIEAVQNIKQRHTIPYTTVMKMLMVLATRAKANLELNIAGYNQIRLASIEVMEKNYLQVLEEQWRGLSWSAEFCVILRSSRFTLRTRKSLHPTDTTDLGGRYSESIASYFGQLTQAAKCGKDKILNKGKHYVSTARMYSTRKACSLINYMVPDIVKFINVLFVVSLLLSIARECQHLLNIYSESKERMSQTVAERDMAQIELMYKMYVMENKEKPTRDEFIEYLEKVDPQLATYLKSEEEVTHQTKRKSEQELERVVAFVALVLMMFDCERSDCVTKVLTKLKNLMSSVEPNVYHQSLDEISDELSEKNLTIDFEIAQDESPTQGLSIERTFQEWWDHQLTRGITIPHYRTEGRLITFTRDTALHVANEIAQNNHTDYLLMGAVGSGKSTGLPYNLSKKGNVLLLEPTRPLAENVHRQLAKEPFYTNTTLRMRGLTAFGSAPITIMTTGFALHYFAHNRSRLNEYDFVILDECHVHDANAMAMCCLIHDSLYTGKLIKASATPPGREVTFNPQHPVNIIPEETLSFQNFVQAQGSGSNCDMTRHGDNILVYVASYSEVDILSALLIEKGFKVTKVDGRTMKVGRVEIVTTGTPAKKHFIVATNIIENGVTLDVEVVVDFGTKVVPYLDSDNRMMNYNKVAVNFGERIQRVGRVGRYKPGTALRIGHTEEGLSEVPSSIATEAAFKCFTYGLPVITNNVTTSLLAHATVPQARTMAQFEVTPFYMVHLVRFDGSMHPAIHSLLRKFKLRDSEIFLNKLAIPNKGLRNWMTGSEYAKLGCTVDDRQDIRIPFVCKGIPEKLHTDVWETIMKHKADAGFGRLTSAGACKIAYTLQTDVTAIQRTVRIIDSLIAEERVKQEYFKTVTSNTVSSSNFSLQSIANAIRSRFATDHTRENIGVLEAAKAQLCEFRNLSVDHSFERLNDTISQNFIRDFGALETVQHQSKHDISKCLGIKGRWNSSLITRDVLVLAGVLGGGIWMLLSHYLKSANELVHHEAKGTRQKQKLKFRQARDNKNGREVYGDDGTIEHYFGAAYREKGKVAGKVRGMGSKQRRFVNMYGFDPEDFSAVRFVDPLTGATLDDNPMTDIHLIQEHFTAIRENLISEDKLDVQHIRNQPGIEAYYTNNRTGKALKIDLTPHNPLRSCDKKATIAGFPEREFELRQTGAPQHIQLSDVPKEQTDDGVNHESVSLFKGLRDYNPISSNVCKLTNKSDGHEDTLYGIGYGPLILTNRHLFERNNGELLIQTRNGEFLIRNTTQINLFPIPDRDLILLRLPKDVPRFPQKLTFRSPVNNERICMVGSNFQAKSISSLISESSTTMQVKGSNFWKHWISTKDGQCGTPIVSTRDGAILGLHSLSNFANSINYFSSFPNEFTERYLDTHENHEWAKHWKYNTSSISWGSLNIKAAQPKGMFNTTKLVMNLDDTAVYSQMARGGWMYNQLHGNLKAVATVPSQLVTKHTVKGKCQMSDLYLRLHDEERAFFEPLMGFHQKSRLNKEAYAKDLLKYASVIEVGLVDCDVFEQALAAVIDDLKTLGFQECNYTTDENCIFDALNMKSAVGALYQGKKKDYFADYTQEMKDQILFESCERLYKGEMGVWNGSLKAELRPLEKVEANKTRTFTAAPIDTLLAGKVCVDDFNNQFYDHHLNGPWSVGMTKFYGGWDTLLNKLPDGWVHCDADGSQFDSSLSPYLINAVLRIRQKFMEPWQVGEQMLLNLYTEIVYTPISTPDGTLVKKFKGNNSGQPSTVVDNTLMVVLAMRYSLLKAGLPVNEHKDMCKFIVNGDDLLLSLAPEYEHILDTLTDRFSELGLKYTFCTKTRNKQDLWFMSHKGIRREGIWIPKLEQERIVSILEWDRSKEPEHRLEAICAAMIESWGYDALTHEIRKFYSWLLSQAPYSGLAQEGKAPYIAESALRKLYLDKDVEQSDITKYIEAIFEDYVEGEFSEVFHQSGKQALDAGLEEDRNLHKDKGKQSVASEVRKDNTQIRDKDVNVGVQGSFPVPRLKTLTGKMNLPLHKRRVVLNLEHLLSYSPNQVDLSNTRATQNQFASWYEGVKSEYDVDDDKMAIILNGFMVWCIENGTSPNINGVWVMMDGEEQVEFPLKPIIDHAKPTLRQIMAHFSNVAEAYIERRNYDRPYMPRYGLQRNLTDMSLARFAFDFYEMTSKTPVRAREAHIQMKAAALRGAKNHLFGLDGNVGSADENTERHTTDDVNRNMHNLLGVRGV